MGDGLWGQSDLAGNLWEWTQDWNASLSASRNNCTQSIAASGRVLRGGGWDFGATYLTAASRYGYAPYGAPTYRDRSFGLRCARTP